MAFLCSGQLLPRLRMLIAGVFLCGGASFAWGAPPPAPEGFIWRASGVETYDSLVALTDAFELTLNVSLPATGAEADSATDGLNIGSFIALPSNTATTYYEPLASANTIDFAVTGYLTGEQDGKYTYDWDFIFSHPGGVESHVETGAKMKNKLNTTVTLDSGGPITLGFLDPSDELSLDANLRLDFEKGKPKGSGTYIDGYIGDFSGTLRINQSYTVYTLEGINPEPSSTLLLMLGSMVFFRRRR